LADTGTILLDEIGDMDVKLQAKLLQVLQDGEFQRLGGKDMVRVDVRILAATHRDLEKAIDAGTFREDLYYRLNVIKLHVPPLRERKEDILPIAASLMERHAPQGSAVPQLTPGLREAMLRYDWPGNVRELENVTRRFLILRDPELLIVELDSKAASRSLKQFNGGQDTPRLASLGPSPVLEQVREANENAERTAILAAMNSTRWNRKQAAAVLNIDYKALLYKMKKLQIDGSVDLHSSPKVTAAGSTAAGS
jgi:two-component system response regulator AtoC